MFHKKGFYLVFAILLSLASAVGCADQTPASPTSASVAPTQPAASSQPPPSNSETGAVVTTIEPITLKFHSYATPPPSASGLASQYFMDEVTRRTNGAVTWEIFWSSTLADTAGQLDLASKGTVDVSKTCLLYFPAKFPIGHFEYAFPFGPDDAVMVTKAKRQIYEEFPEKRAEFDNNDVVMLANTVCGYYELQSKVPVHSLSDMQGRKVGMVGRYFGRWFEPVGAAAVVAGAPDRYTHLQGGVVDQSLLWLDLAYSLSLHEQAKYLIQIGLGSYLAEDILMGKDRFNSFDPELQKILLEVGKESELWAAEYQKANKDKIIPLMEQEGTTVIKFPEEDRSKWATMVDDIAAEWAIEATEAGAPGWEIAKRWQEITTDMGYKWAKQWAVKQ